MVIKKKGCRENNKSGMMTSGLQNTSYKISANRQPTVKYNNFDKNRAGTWVMNEPSTKVKF